MRRLFVVTTLIALSAAPAAEAAEWRYCLARAPAAHRLMLSRIGHSVLTITEAETAFGRVLDDAGIAHDAVLCPRAGDQSTIESAEAQAIRFNELEHYAPSVIDWSP
jgi:hypothetical protein